MRADSEGEVAGVVLAAGLARRFGGGKMLADIHGKPMLQHVLDLARGVEFAPVVVVLGEAADEIATKLGWRDETRVVNPNPAAGMAGSVRIGLGSLEETAAERAVILLGDQPFVTPTQLATLLAADGPIVVPRYAGVSGNPVVIRRDAWPLAASLKGDRGMSQLFGEHSELVCYVDVPGTNPDIDTPADLEGISRA